MDDLFDVFESEEKDNKRKLTDQVEVEVEDDGIFDKIANEIESQGTERKRIKTENEENDLVIIDDDVNEDEEKEKFEPRVTIHEIETKEVCLHEVVTPINLEYVPLREPNENEGHKPAKEYEFKLDPFQKEAILCIENNQSVLGN